MIAYTCNKCEKTNHIASLEISQTGDWIIICECGNRDIIDEQSFNRKEEEEGVGMIYDIAFSLNRSLCVPATSYEEAIEKLKQQLEFEGIDLKETYTYEEYDCTEETIENLAYTLMIQNEYKNVYTVKIHPNDDEKSMFKGEPTVCFHEPGQSLDRPRGLYQYLARTLLDHPTYLLLNAGDPATKISKEDMKRVKGLIQNYLERVDK